MARLKGPALRWWHRLRTTGALLLPALLLSTTDGYASEAGIVTLQVENDVVSGSDRNYTNGLLLSYLSPATTAEHISQRIARRLPFLDPDHGLRFGLGLGHNIFTPEDKDARALVRDDRPYAAWLYFSFSLLSYQERNARPGALGDVDFMQTLALDLGVIGPAALGEEIQNNWHTLIGVEHANGWDNQLENEPGVNLTYQRRWRLWFCCGEGGFIDADAMPSFGGALGNVMTYASAGLSLRFGHGLRHDFGPPRIRPSLPGYGHFDPGQFSWYVFAGVEGRAVAQNIFLDGNSFRDSHSVDKRHMVGDAQVGLALTLGNFRISYTHVFGTPEAEGLAPHQFGALSASWRVRF